MPAFRARFAASTHALTMSCTPFVVNAFGFGNASEYLSADGAHTSSGHPPFIVVAVAPWLSHGAIVDALHPA